MGVAPNEFIQAAIWHGDLARAEAMLAADPQLATANIYTAAVLGDDDAVRGFLRVDPSCARAAGGPWGTQPLVYLGLSRYLRLDAARSDSFLCAATAMLDAGADPNAGFWSNGEFETALYGAAGVAHHPDLTKLLLERGADPNDVEVVYHTPETYDNRALKLVVETGEVTPENLALMLVRKHDWHDFDGVQWLLQHGADPNHHHEGRWQPLHHAIKRDNHIAIIDLLLDYGADPTSVIDGASAIALAARHGRADVLQSIRRRGVPLDLEGDDALLAKCAIDEPVAGAVRVSDPGASLARFAGNGNVAGLKRLLALGVDVNAPFAEGDGYWDVAPQSTALHVAAWRAQHEAVRFLLERDAAFERKDGKGRTPLVLAVKACVDSYWSARRAPDSVKALIEAGASVLHGVTLPTGYDEIDALLSVARATEFGGASPIFRVADLSASVAYYVDKLGFRIDWEYHGQIAAVVRGRCSIFLSEGDQGNVGAWVWIGVGDVDVLYAELAASGALIRQPPTNFAWACEMQVTDPDGNVLRIGSDSKEGVPFGPWRDMNDKLWYARSEDVSWESSQKEET